MRKKKPDSWSLYVAQCADGSYYTGIAKDVGKRLEAHNAGRGAKYTATRGPVTLLFEEPQRDYSAALRREYQVKRLPKARKVRFAQGEPLPRPRKRSKMSFQAAKRKPKANRKTPKKTSLGKALFKPGLLRHKRPPIRRSFPAMTD